MNLSSFISPILLYNSIEEPGEEVGEILFYVILVVVIYLIVRRIRTKK